MSTPIETAAGALASGDPWIMPQDIEGHYADCARRALASLARHRDDIARVLDAHQSVGGAECSCGAVMEHETDGVVIAVYESRHQADAVLAYLTGETS